MSDAETTVKAKDLKAGTHFTYVGAFKTYHAASDAHPDRSYPGKVLIQVRSGDRFFDVRLDADHEVDLP